MYNHHEYLIGISGRMGHGKDLVATIIQLLTWQKHNTAFLLEKQKQSGEDYLGLLPVTDKDLAEAALSPEIAMLLLSRHNPWQVKRFAAGVKQIATLLTGIPVEKFEDQAFKETLLGSEWNLYGCTRDGGQYNPGAWFGSASELYASAWWKNKKQGDKEVVQRRTVRDLLQLIGTDAMRDVIHPQVWVNTLFADWKLETSPNANPPDSEATIGLDVITQWPAQHWLVTDVRFPNEKQAIEQRRGLVIRVVRPGQAVTSTHFSETALDQTAFDATVVNDGTVEQLVHRVRQVLQSFGAL